MSSPPAILIFGHDPQLLETRRLMLEQVGYWIWSASNISEVVRLIEDRDVDLLILCHSLSTEECERAIALSSLRVPPLECLVLTAVQVRQCSANREYMVLDSREGPAKFISEVTRLIAPKGSPPSHFF